MPTGSAAIGDQGLMQGSRAIGTNFAWGGSAAVTGIPRRQLGAMGAMGAQFFGSVGAAAGVVGPPEDASYEDLLALDDTIATKGLSSAQVAQCTAEQTVTQEFLDTMQSTKENDCKICLCDFEIGDKIRR